MRDVPLVSRHRGRLRGDVRSERLQMLLVIGPAPRGGEFVEIIIDNAPLQKAMLRFSWNILLLSLVISAITATLVYLSLHYLFVRPMRRITANMMAFRADPENPVARARGRPAAPTRSARPSTSSPAMQRDLASMLHQKNRLAALGLAVSKINHDLRNLLASAQLVSDQLLDLARSEGAALRAQADARARTRDRLLPVDLVLWPRAGAAARPQDDRA